jgi:hypothetical protein
VKCEYKAKTTSIASGRAIQKRSSLGLVVSYSDAGGLAVGDCSVWLFCMAVLQSTFRADAVFRLLVASGVFGAGSGERVEAPLRLAGKVAVHEDEDERDEEPGKWLHRAFHLRLGWRLRG